MSVKDRQGLFLNGTSHLTLISFKVRPILNCLKKKVSKEFKHFQNSFEFEIPEMCNCFFF